jgi:DNA-binding MarR family transcriptional regulator
MENIRKEDINEEVVRLMAVLLREAARRQESILTKGNISVSNIVVIDILKEKGSCSMRQISEALNLTMGAATGIIDKMTAAGLVKRERQKDDRRVVKVSLRPGGHKVHEKINKFRGDVTADLFSALTEREKREYLRILKKMYFGITGTGNEEEKI